MNRDDIARRTIPAVPFTEALRLQGIVVCNVLGVRRFGVPGMQKMSALNRYFENEIVQMASNCINGFHSQTGQLQTAETSKPTTGVGIRTRGL